MKRTVQNIYQIRCVIIIASICFFLTTSLNAKEINEVKTSQESETPTTEVVAETKQNLKKVKGFVVDEFGEPMVGVEVYAVGSEESAVTNAEGKYTVMALESDVLKFSQVGVADKEEKITSSRIVNVSMSIE